MKRKRKWLSLLLAVCIVVCTLCVLPSTASADDVCFIAINENLLELSTMPAFVGASVYVPYWVFESFRIYYSFFSSDNIAMVYTEAKQFYFELGSGNTYDNDGIYYTAQAIFRNGQVYLPAKFICDQFGLTYSYISGSGHGDIVRIVDGSAVLSDEKFLSAASLLMESYYNAYMGLIASPAPSPGPTPVRPDDEPNRRDTEVLLSFTSLPSKAILDTLEQYGTKACFLLSPEDIPLSPDTVRRIVASGHSLGILCGDDPSADYEAAASLLFDAARVTPLLVASVQEDDLTCREMAAQHALAFLDYDVDAVQNGEGARSAAVVTSQIEFSQGLVSVRLTSGGTTEQILADILSYLNQNHFSIRAPRETDAAA